MSKYEIIVHEIKTDGLPDMDNLTGRVAFIWDGAICSGWPLYLDDPSDPESLLWEASEDEMGRVKFHGVTHWVEFPKPVWKLS